MGRGQAGDSGGANGLMLLVMVSPPALQSGGGDVELMGYLRAGQAQSDHEYNRLFLLVPAEMTSLALGSGHEGDSLRVVNS